jgi:hypothetical protein
MFEKILKLEKILEEISKQLGARIPTGVNMDTLKSKKTNGKKSNQKM